MLEKKDLKWKQQTKQRWLKEGDRNTIFFHKYASQRGQTNHINSIRDGDGNTHTSPQGISKTFQNFYTDLFTISVPIGTTKCLEAMQPLVSEEINQ